MKTHFAFLTVVLALPASAAVLQFDLLGKGGSGLLTTNENGSVTGGGSGGEIGGGISYDDVANNLTINVGWGSGNGFADLTGAANGSHIHGPTASTGAAAFNENASVLFNLTRNDSSAAGGFISTVVNLSTVQETELLGGRYYINIHTGTNGGGEIRGNLVLVPEPSALVLGALGLPMLLRRRR